MHTYQTFPQWSNKQWHCWWFIRINNWKHLINIPRSTPWGRPVTQRLAKQTQSLALNRFAAASATKQLRKKIPLSLSLDFQRTWTSIVGVSWWYVFSRIRDLAQMYKSHSRTFKGHINDVQNCINPKQHIYKHVYTGSVYIRQFHMQCTTFNH